MRCIMNIGFVLVLVLLAAPAAAEPATQVFQVPDGARPHDIAPAPDGTVWYTAQNQGALGILDPAAGKVRQVSLGDGSRPHGVIAGPDGAAWITDGGLNAIVRFDPATDEVKTWPLPDSADDANLNTPPSTATACCGSPARPATTAGSIRGPARCRCSRRPRGAAPTVSTRRPPARSGTPRSPAATSPISTAPPARPRWCRRRARATARAASGPTAGAICGSVCGTSASSARYAPAAREWKTWQLPGDVPRAYAVYVDDRDVVWVSDFGANAVLSFDPKSERFTAYPGSADSADVRQILGRPGEVWLPESGTDRLMVIRTGG